MGPKGGIATGQRQHSPGSERLDRLADGWAGGQPALDTCQSDAQGVTADVVELALVHRRVNPRASDAEPARGLGRRERGRLGIAGVARISRERLADDINICSDGDAPHLNPQTAAT
jgi:hypothetical protein